MKTHVLVSNFQGGIPSLPQLNTIGILEEDNLVFIILTSNLKYRKQFPLPADAIQNIIRLKYPNATFKEYYSPRDSEPLFFKKVEAMGNMYYPESEVKVHINVPGNDILPNPTASLETAENYALGITQAVRRRYPISTLTVDMAITVNFGKDELDEWVLLGKKPKESLWRFPGGFVDIADVDLETAVLREAREEVFQNTVLPNLIPKYIGSTGINDWRYAQSEDRIFTTFFEIKITAKDLAYVKAGDDLMEAHWHRLSHTNKDNIMHEHIVLFNMLRKYKGYAE